METKNFKSVTFGGFDKEEVIHYIQESAREQANALAAIQEENQRLQDSACQLEAENAQLRDELDRLNREKDELVKAKTQELQEKVRLLTGQVAELRPLADSYREVRTQVGDIECQARKRASELETATAAKLTALVDAVQKQYAAMAASFSAESGSMVSQLKKIEAGISQLPRSMDQTGKELSNILSTINSRKKF
jgi:hypothetical protein